MRRWLVSLLLVVSAVLGCSSEDRWDPGVPNIPRTDLYVANFSAERILAVHVMPAGSGAWGENWLVGPIAPGNLYAYVGQVISGQFDIRMVGSFTTVEVFGFTCVGDAIAVSFHPAATSAAAAPRRGP